MIRFQVNGRKKTFSGDTSLSLLTYLREYENIVSPKDGCSGQAVCGACLVEVNGRAVLACSTPLKKLQDAAIVTIEGFPKNLRRTLGRAFVAQGAVQCGFCTPGFLTRTKLLLENNPAPTRAEILEALRFHLCRCTGYIKIVEAIEVAARILRQKECIEIPAAGKIGTRQPKYQAYSKALGRSPFVDDMRVFGMLYGALKFSEHSRARVLAMDLSKARKLNGVYRIFTGEDIPGQRITGIIVCDWPVMVVCGETTRYIGDVLAGVVAETEQIARQAVDLIEVEYEVYQPLTDMQAAETSAVKIHPKGNLLKSCRIQRGQDVAAVIEASAHVVQACFRTQRVEHAFLETEAALAVPWKKGGVKVYVQSQGVYEDRRKLARILGLPEEKVSVALVPSGGGFGGKEDLTVQGHAALFCLALQQPVKVKLNRAESLRMHPKRHPMIMDYTLACNAAGRLTALRARILGDTGAYASLGGEVLERSAGHATGGYHVPNVDITAKALYTNNLPCGAMRGFGVNQVTFAMESAVDELCAKGGFDRWQFRYDNALDTGKMTATGQVLGDGIGLKATLLAVKDEFYQARYAGLACGLKNCGIGNGVAEISEVKLEIKAPQTVVLHHGWTEMGQGLDTVAQQILCEETGILPAQIKIAVCTESSAAGGVTTASRGTVLLGNAIRAAAHRLKEDLQAVPLSRLAGKVYCGRFVCDWTTKAGEAGEVRTHFSYGYATQLAVLDDNGRVDTIYAAHDAGKIINPTLFEGQIQGGVLMGLGYALSETLPLDRGLLRSTHLAKLGLLKAHDAPRIVVKGLEVEDPVGPYGAKGVGEIATVPTAAAVANALCQYDGIRRYELPLKRKVRR
jgi:aldehyde oxidoreductase